MTATRPTPFPQLNDVLQQLVESQKAILQGNFVAAYLQGSFAVGGFDRHSDADWIVVTGEELSGEQVEALQAMHSRIHDLDNPWAPHLEGSYFPQDVLRPNARSGAPLWYLDHGARTLIRSGHCNTLVVRCVLRRQGIALAGPPPAMLVDPIPVNELRREILATLNGWGAEILADPEQINNHFYQSFVVLNYARMLHDLQTGKPGSKRSGADWAKANLDPQWADLIDRAWSGRPDPARSVRRPADPLELQRTLAFLRYVMDASVAYAAIKGL